MKYRLIATDLDGTLIERGGSIVSSAKGVIRRAIDRGIKVTLATGRMYKPSNQFAQELGICMPLICYQGAMIREPDNQDILWHKPLSVSLARKVIKHIKQLDVQWYVYVDDEMYVEEIRDGDLWYAERNWVEIHLVEDLCDSLEKPPTEIAVRGESSQLDHLMTRLDAHFGSDLLVTNTYPSFREIAHPMTGKGNALAFLAKRLGIERGEVVAIGDSHNDISMLEWAGLGIAVGNAPEEVRAAADWVVDAGIEEGFAQAMEKLLDM